MKLGLLALALTACCHVPAPKVVQRPQIAAPRPAPDPAWGKLGPLPDRSEIGPDGEVDDDDPPPILRNRP